MAGEQQIRMTAEQFIAWERKQPDKHEFHGGQVFAMAGGSPRHNKIAAMIVSTLTAVFRERPCDALGSDQMVRVGSSFVYPDVSVVCGEAQYERVDQGLLLLNPSAIFEVLSGSTEGYDRGQKSKLYRGRPSLRDYVLVSQREACIEHHQLRDGVWVLVTDDARPGSSISLADGAQLHVDAVYQGVWKFPDDTL